MKCCLTKVVLIFIFFINNAYGNNFSAEYSVTTSGIKIGEFNWMLKIQQDEFKTEIYLKNSGIFSPLYKFEGKYNSEGIIRNNKLESTAYRQYWKTKKKIKIIEMSFDGYLTRLFQQPRENEVSRVNFSELSGYFDPITSFINILRGNIEAKTIDGRRVYKMQNKSLDKSKKIEIEIVDYKNIWADHKRNDLKKIEFFMGEERFLPEKIEVYFKDRVFKLKKN